MQNEQSNTIYGIKILSEIDSEKTTDNALLFAFMLANKTIENHDEYDQNNFAKTLIKSIMKNKMDWVIA